MYIPPLAHSSLLHSIHLFSLVTLDISEIRQLSNATSGGQVSLCLSTTLSLVALFASKTRSTHTLSPRLFLLSSLPHLFHSRKFLLILSQTFPSLMVMICWWSWLTMALQRGYIILAPCSKTIEANGFAQLFFDHVFKYFGLHDIVISDCGPQFASAFTRELAWIIKYDDIYLSTTYHPQTNGQTEQINQEVETYLWIFYANNPHQWSKFLTSAEFQHNLVPHSSTKVSLSFPSSSSMTLVCILHLGKPYPCSWKSFLFPWIH